MMRYLIVFGRYPQPGLVKTRLIPLLGPLGAADWQRAMTERTLRTALSSKLAPVGFFFDGGDRARVRRWLRGLSVECSPQPPGDLGARMQAALFGALSRGCGQVVLVGTDVPALTPAHLHQAFAALAAHDVVLGPSRDGGYWLVGLRRPAAIFDRIAWGGAAVLAQTMEGARRQGFSVAQLACLADVDTPADLAAWRPPAREAIPRPYLSVVIPAFNEAGCIQDSVARIDRADAQVIVVDGGSRDRTVSLALQAGATVLRCSRGRARQQNLGARRATGRLLLFLHADTRLPPDYGAQIFELMLDRRVAAGAFRFKTDYDRPAMRLIERMTNLRAGLLRMPYGDQGLFVRSGIFNAAGGFPQVPIAEDLYLVRRLARLGRIALAPGTAVTSGRRWRRIGIWRTTWINAVIAVGCLLGMDPARLAALYER